MSTPFPSPFLDDAEPARSAERGCARQTISGPLLVWGGGDSPVFGPVQGSCAPARLPSLFERPEPAAINPSRPDVPPRPLTREQVPSPGVGRPDLVRHPGRHGVGRGLAPSRSGLPAYARIWAERPGLGSTSQAALPWSLKTLLPTLDDRAKRSS